MLCVKPCNISVIFNAKIQFASVRVRKSYNRVDNIIIRKAFDITLKFYYQIFF